MLSFLLLRSNALAYVGPGAGFAVISSFLILFVTFILAFFTILTFPLRAVILHLKRRKVLHRSKIKRAVILGLDGFDPALCRLYMNEGKLPNFQKLARTGSFRTLSTTTPPISPVAWSSFATGVNPGKHRIFDFLTRNPKSYLPMLSSASIHTDNRTIKLGPWRIKSKKPIVKLLRKSTPFWTLLGEKKVFSAILRVPITFPPEKFYGICLSAMCTPDLLGTQGTFAEFTTEKNQDANNNPLSGITIPLELQNSKFQTHITGPSFQKNGTNQPLIIPVEGKIDYNKKTVELKIGKTHYLLSEGKYSAWINLPFKSGPIKKVHGIARFLVTQIEPHLTIYMTPINIDPEKPALPISNPFYYAICVAKTQGPFATLGLAEDTKALNERVINEGAFLEQAYDIYEDRKKLFFNALTKNKKGLLVFVFDTTDRIQHMFFRYLSPDHPANKGKDTTLYKDAIEQLYMKMDELVGEVLPSINDHDLLMIISDHGFKPFKWGVNLNSWLWKEGYLTLKEGASLGEEWFANVDWSRTRAYAMGLAGIYINVSGREAIGTVEPGEAKVVLQKEIKQKLESLRDERQGNKPVRKVVFADEALHGPYVSEAPDLFVGYEEGYRVSWNSAVGKITEEVFEDNTHSWSGDHSIDPELVPGIFFSNWRLNGEKPSIQDIAPTILNMFGLEKPSYQDGNIMDLVCPAHHETGDNKS